MDATATEPALLRGLASLASASQECHIQVLGPESSRQKSALRLLLTMLVATLPYMPGHSIL